MNKIQNTLGAVALSLGIATSSAYSQDTSKVVNTTNSAVVAATTSNSGNAGKITPKIDISALVFPKDVKLLLDEAKKYEVEVKDGIRDEKEFGSLQSEIIEEEKRLGELRELIKDKKIERYLIVKRKDLDLKIVDENGKDSLNVDKTIDFLRGREKLAQQVEKDFVIKDGADIRMAEGLAEIAKIKEESTKIKEESTKIKEESTKIKEESTKIKEESTKIKEEIGQIDQDIAKIQAETKEIEQRIYSKVLEIIKLAEEAKKKE